MRVFPLSDTLKSTSAVIGDALILVLLGDLHKRNDRLPVAMLKGPDMPVRKLTGFRSVDDFAKELVNSKGFKYQNTFTRAIKMVASSGVDVHQCVQLGLSSIFHGSSTGMLAEMQRPAGALMSLWS